MMTRQILIFGEVRTDRRSIGRSIAHPKGEGRWRGRAPPGGTGTAAADGAGADDAEARDVEVVAPLGAMLSCDRPASTHVGELWRAARRRSVRACRKRWPERLSRWAGEVGVTGLRLGERSCMR
jgi:hypothetical protein